MQKFVVISMHSYIVAAAGGCGLSCLSTATYPYLLAKHLFNASVGYWAGGTNSNSNSIVGNVLLLILVLIVVLILIL
jgi:hypothetical protein